MERKWSIKNEGDVEKISGSYVKREDFIEMLSNLSFTHIASADIELITGFYIRKDEDYKDELFSVGYNFRIE